MPTELIGILKGCLENGQAIPTSFSMQGKGWILSPMCLFIVLV